MDAEFATLLARTNENRTTPYMERFREIAGETAKVKEVSKDHILVCLTDGTECGDFLYPPENPAYHLALEQP